MIRVLLVDESPAALEALREGLEGLGFDVVGTARSTAQAMQMVASLKPQVLCAALSLGVELTREVMREAPLPVLLLASEPVDSSAPVVREAREAGALDVLTRPQNAAGTSMPALGSRLRVLSGVKMFARRSDTTEPAPRVSSPAAPRVVAIGASTGGPQALGKLLSGLEASFPWPVLCVQHISGGFLDGLVSWLGTQTRLGVHLARHGDLPTGGQVYFAPEGYHLRVTAGSALSLEQGEPVDGHRPSATVLFSSVAEVYGSAAVGLLLTGMGSDGARGLLEMARAGALTLAQDEESCVVFGMPRQAVELGAVKQAHSLDEIGAQLRSYAKRGIDGGF